MKTTQQLLLKMTHPIGSVKLDQHGARLTQNQGAGVGEGEIVEKSEEIYDQVLKKMWELDNGDSPADGSYSKNRPPGTPRTN